MINERGRNLLVGITMIVSLVVMMYGILLLGKVQAPGGLGTYNITLLTPNAGGIINGGRVQLNGVMVGQVSAVELQSRATSAGTTPLLAKLILKIDAGNNIPLNAHTVIEKPSVGNALVSIQVSEMKGPMIPQDGTGTLLAESADTGLIPQSVIADIHNFTQLSTQQLTIVARDLHTLLDYTSPEAIEKADPNDPNRPKENISTVVIRLDRTMKGLETLLNDPNLHASVRESILNINEASKQLKTTLQTADATLKNYDTAAKTLDTTIKNAGGVVNSFGTAATQATATLETTQREVVKVSQRLADTLGQIEKTVRDINEGKGTTGRLINDPRLYDGLLDLSKSLRSTVDDLDFLLKKWKDEGVNLKFK